jgi:hypothetical protein
MILMLLAVEMLIHVIYLPIFENRIAHEPQLFWLWTVPYNLAIEATMVALILVRSRRANLVLLVLLLLLLMVPYWDQGSIQNALARRYGYG